MSVFRPAVGLIALMLSALACGADADQRWLTDEKGCKAVAPDKAKGIAVKLIWNGACVEAAYVVFVPSVFHATPLAFSKVLDVSRSLISAVSLVAGK